MLGIIHKLSHKGIGWGGGRPKYDDWSQFEWGGLTIIWYYDKSDQLNLKSNFKKSVCFTIWPQLDPCIQIWVCDQAEQNRGNLNGTQDGSTHYI